jgi:hypothetical protein
VAAVDGVVVVYPQPFADSRPRVKPRQRLANLLFDTTCVGDPAGNTQWPLRPSVVDSDRWRRVAVVPT